MYGLDLFFVHSDALIRDNVAQESYFILIKTTLFKFGIQWVLPLLVQHPLNSLYVLFALAFNLDKDVIKLHYPKNVELFCQDLDDLALKRSWCIG